MDGSRCVTGFAGTFQARVQLEGVAMAPDGRTWATIAVSSRRRPPRCRPADGRDRRLRPARKPRGACRKAPGSRRSFAAEQGSGHRHRPRSAPVSGPPPGTPDQLRGGQTSAPSQVYFLWDTPGRRTRPDLSPMAGPSCRGIPRTPWAKNCRLAPAINGDGGCTTQWMPAN